MRPTASRATLSVVIVLFAFAMLGGLFGSKLLATESTEPAVAETESGASLHLFTDLLNAVEVNFASPVDTEKAVYGAIDGMLRTLDPHSRFMNPKDFATLRDDQRGKYYGLGIQVATRPGGKITVVSPPFPNSPAEKAGLRVGDVITHINGDPTDKIDLNAAVSRLKGPRGTEVKITIARQGMETPIQLSVIRDEIAKYTINYAFLVKPRIGYIKLESFAETTGNELRESLRKLDYKNLDGLVFDLRGNPGGLLQEAIEVGETFLQRNQVIVETRGRSGGRGANHAYASQRANTDNLYPVVVLINENSASASEIVSGALQDHDRALIIGETSFGKGLVQSVYPLSKSGGLLLTTQKWYTPSGRLIQRDYSQISQYDYYNHRDNVAEKPKTDIKYSDLGRIVYGGGGIIPDHVFPEVKATPFEDLLLQKCPLWQQCSSAVFYTFVKPFLDKNPTIDSNFQTSDAMVNDFKQFIQKRGIAFTDSEFEADKDFIKLRIRNEVVYNRLGTNEASRVLIQSDPLVLKAIELLPEAKDLQTKVKRQVVQQQQ